MTRQRIIVTGGTGFIGSRVVARLVDKGERVTVLTRDPSRAPSSVEAVSWDLEGGSVDRALLADTAAVVHLAAYRPAKLDDPRHAERCLLANGIGTLRLLEDVVGAGVPVLINVTAANAYRDTGRPAREDDALFPSGRAPYYLVSKVVQEVFGDHFAKRFPLRVVSLRPSAVYGPGMGPSGLIPTLAGRLRAGDPVDLADGGRYSADLVYVDDVVDAVVTAIQRPVNGAFNIASGRLVSALEIAETIATLCSRSRELLRLQPAGGSPAGGFCALEITRAQDELGFQPRTLEAGLRSYLTWANRQES